MFDKEFWASISIGFSLILLMNMIMHGITWGRFQWNGFFRAWMLMKWDFCCFVFLVCNCREGRKIGEERWGERERTGRGKTCGKSLTVPSFGKGQWYVSIYIWIFFIIKGPKRMSPSSSYIVFFYIFFREIYGKNPPQLHTSQQDPVPYRL